MFAKLAFVIEPKKIAVREYTSVITLFTSPEPRKREAHEGTLIGKVPAES
jgi:hypothetical protein